MCCLEIVGSSFLERALQEILHHCSMVHTLTSAYHRQTNGLTELFSYTLADMISFYVPSEHKSWSTVLRYLTFAYNIAAESITSYSPFRLLFTQAREYTINTIFPYSNTAQDFTLADSTPRFEECRQRARSRTAEGQVAAKLRCDGQHRHTAYQTAHLVWLWAPIRKPRLAKKFLRQYIGPYRALEEVSSVTCSVEPVKPPTDRRSRSCVSTQDIYLTLIASSYRSLTAFIRCCSSGAYIIPTMEFVPPQATRRIIQCTLTQTF